MTDQQQKQLELALQFCQAKNTPARIYHYPDLADMITGKMDRRGIWWEFQKFVRKMK